MEREQNAVDQEPEAIEVLRIDREAQMTLEARRQLTRPQKPGWWRNAPNPHAVGSKINDDEL